MLVELVICGFYYDLLEISICKGVESQEAYEAESFNH